MINPKEIFTVGMILFAVIDIIGSVPIIIELRKKVGHIQSEKASIVSVLIMIAFLFIGEEILNIIGIDVNSFAVAGAFVIFFISLEMVLGVSIYKDETPETASIVPIAFPLIAGAGTLTTLLSLRAEFEHQLYKMLKKEWENIEKKELEKLVESMPRRCAAVIEMNGQATKY